MATDYSKYNQSQYDNQKAYLENLQNSGSAGQAAWAKNELASLNSQYKPSTPTTQPTQQSAPAGNSGVTNNANKNNVNTGDKAFISPGSTVADDGTRYHSFGENDQYKVKDYLSGNSDLQYALQQAMKANGSNTYDIDGYVNSLYDRIGTSRNDGSVVTLADIDRELDRLGLSDYNSQNAIYTASGKVLPNNKYVAYKDGNSEVPSNSADSRWATYGGQDYLIGGDSANYVDYVNGKTGNTSILDYLFDDMAKNPYAQQDPEFMAQFNKDLANLYANAGIQTPSAGNTGIAGSVGNTGGGYTGYQKVDQLIDYANSWNSYNQLTGGTGGDIWSEIKAMLDGGYEAQQAFIESQRTRAEQDAENLMRQAYVTNKLQGDSVKEAMSAAGLGTTGAMQSAMLGVQNSYNNNVADIRSNLNTMLSGLSEQELQALTDYMNKSTDYYYQVQNDMQDRAYQNAQLYMQQAEMQQAQQQQDWENAYKQQLLDAENQQYADSQARYADETEYARNQDSAEYYAALYKAGQISRAEYEQRLRELGFVA